MEKHFTVFGNPIQQSLSPFIHQAFAKQFNFEITYTKTFVPIDMFAKALNDFKQAGGVGANVTLPFKAQAYSLCEQLSDTAKKAQAVNTLYWAANQLCGDNTDGIGFLRDIKRCHPEGFHKASVLVCGAGGAASGILGSILGQDPAEIFLVNRDKMRALNLAKRFQSDRILPCTFNELKELHLEKNFNIVINATSASLQKKLLPLHNRHIQNVYAYDLAYDIKKPTAFVAWALENGARQADDGLGMLVGQASESFMIWHAKMPQTESVMAHLRAGYFK